MDLAELALIAVNNIPTMVAYSDADERCVFSNEACREWFGRSPSDMVNMSIRELLGPLRKESLQVRGALRREREVFERRIELPGDGSREVSPPTSPMRSMTSFAAFGPI